MTQVAFADESGTDAHCCCYAIGAVSIPTERCESFEQKICSLKSQHGVMGEAKWTRVRTGHGLINFALDCLDLVLTSPGVTFDVIVVNKRLYNKWQGNTATREVAFYKTYTYLLRHISTRVRDTTDVFIDARSDRYAKRDEAMMTIGNRMLARLASTGRLGAVRKTSSHESVGIQVADILTGAINTGHLLRLQRLAIHPGKLLALERLARRLGWSHLGHDTFPHPKFNIWHFPIEFRGPSRDPAPTRIVHYVTAGDMAAHPRRG